ncbi:MAG: hypothetical protein N2249_00535 [Melioribacter sp.]|nr:hypothetical protein [Melioribacter sp.]
MSNQILPSYVISYLKKFSSNKWELEISHNKKFNNVIVVPAIEEFENIICLINSILEIDKKYLEETLLLIVINNPPNCKEEIKNNNKKTIELLRNIISKNNNELSRLFCSSKLYIGLVDASSKGKELPEKEAGAGLARKIGMDLALKVFDYKNSRKKILISLDADCIVEKNYLTEIVNAFNEKNINAATVYYEHILPENEDIKNAIIMYELFLRYYVAGLKYANSPYAYQSIGSTIVCTAEYYCKAGGMNKRKAGEDFYFLEKLAKLTSIYKINNTTVYPSARSSLRTPFGTGKTISKYLSNPQKEFLVYNPLCFDILKNWLDLFYSSNVNDENYYINNSEKIHPALKKFLEINKFAKAWKNILLNSKTTEQLTKQKTIWFDAFRTLKLIHYLKENSFPQVNIFYAIDELLKRFSIAPLNLETKEKYLFTMRNLSKAI